MSDRNISAEKRDIVAEALAAADKARLAGRCEGYPWHTQVLANEVHGLRGTVEAWEKMHGRLSIPPKLPPHITQQQAIDAYEWLRNQRSPQADIALELWGRAARHPDDVGGGK